MEQVGGRYGYYAILGISQDASQSEIRRAYRKLALVSFLNFSLERDVITGLVLGVEILLWSVQKWHPDRWNNSRNSTMGNEAKQRFQQIQEAYAVLSDERKRSMYDVGLYDPLEEEDEGFSDFMQEMLSMMANVQNQQNSFEDLQKMFNELTRDDDRVQFHYEDDDDTDQTARKRVRGTAPPSQFNSMPAPVYT
ncbi:hypothetical protein MKW94_017806 [Papaver nudicaule]|uniref:J domain-containing protein n=1 Tax=Papaver nudicaule TaxID=74823 RepID=A0AA41RUZ8_PAPNU|nr:hypothetical protein [Papaver nudicaule]